METGIGATLREARKRRKLELSEVESAIKIRARYLRAMENEEWAVLPGGAYTRGFIRTYAGHLGLDGDRLADEFRQAVGAPAADGGGRHIEPVSRPRRRLGSLLPGWIWVIAVSGLLVAAMVGVGLAVDGGNGSTEPGGNGKEAGSGAGGEQGARPAAQPGVGLEIEALGEVWVCLTDAREKALIDGQILQAGAIEGPFREEEGFMVAFGNGRVQLSIDGRPARTPESSSPIGFEIDSEGRLAELEEGQRPDCE